MDDPDKFSGKDSNIDFDTWKSDIQAKLRVNSKSFNNENHKIKYVCLQTTSNTRNYIQDCINDNEFTTSGEVIKALEAVYGDLY
jgi:hypothetical protein